MYLLTVSLEHVDRWQSVIVRVIYFVVLSQYSLCYLVFPWTFERTNPYHDLLGREFGKPTIRNALP